MLFKVEENINLKDKLFTLQENVKNYDSVKMICERYLSHIETQPHATLASGLINELNGYNFIPAVKDFVDSLNTNINESAISYSSANIYYALKNDPQHVYYGDAINRINNALNKNLTEKDLAKEISYTLKDQSWIPQVKQLVEYANKSLNIGEQAPGFDVKRAYSPILKEGDSSYQYIDGHFLLFNESEGSYNIIDNINVPDKMKDLAQIADSFIIEGNTMKYYYNDHKFEIKEHDNKTELYHNDKLVTEHIDEYVDTLYYTGVFEQHDLYKVNLIRNAFNEYASGNIVELNNAQIIESTQYEGLKTVVIHNNGNVYLGLTNESMGIRKFEKHSPVNAVRAVKEHMNYDISIIIENALNKDRSDEFKRIKETCKKELAFIDKKIAEVKSYGLDDVQDIKDAYDLLNNERRKWSEKLDKANRYLGEMDHDSVGFEPKDQNTGSQELSVDLKVVDKSDAIVKSDGVTIKKSDYEYAKDDDYLKVKLPDGSYKEVLKKNISIKENNNPAVNHDKLRKSDGSELKGTLKVVDKSDAIVKSDGVTVKKSDYEYAKDDDYLKVKLPDGSYKEVLKKNIVPKENITESNEGYSKAIVTKAIGELKPGDKIMVKASDYTSKGKSDKVSIKTLKGKSMKIDKGSVKIEESLYDEGPRYNLLENYVLADRYNFLEGSDTLLNEQSDLLKFRERYKNI